MLNLDNNDDNNIMMRRHTLKYLGSVSRLKVVCPRNDLDL